MLEATNVYASYGGARILFDVSLEVGSGEMVALIGRNGMGKTTTLRSVMGLVHLDRGSIRFLDRDISRLPTHKRVQEGIRYVCQGRKIFPLSVADNLELACVGVKGQASDISSALEYFPELRRYLPYRADRLSGGEQQMLAIARALVGKPRVLLLDEPLEGLAPKLVQRFVEKITEIKNQVAVLIVEQNPDVISDSDQVYVMVNGMIAAKGTPSDMKEQHLIEKYLTVA